MKISICKNRMGKTKEETKPFPIIGPVPDEFLIMNEIFIPGLIQCPHENTEYIDWPDGGSVEICNCCMMSRHHWEQGQTGWIMVDDVDHVKEKLQKSIDRMMEENNNGKKHRHFLDRS